METRDFITKSSKDLLGNETGQKKKTIPDADQLSDLYIVVGVLFIITLVSVMMIVSGVMLF